MNDFDQKNIFDLQVCDHAENASMSLKLRSSEHIASVHIETDNWNTQVKLHFLSFDSHKYQNCNLAKPRKISAINDKNIHKKQITVCNRHIMK